MAWTRLPRQPLPPSPGPREGPRAQAGSGPRVTGPKGAPPFPSLAALSEPRRPFRASPPFPRLAALSEPRRPFRVSPPFPSLGLGGTNRGCGLVSAAASAGLAARQARGLAWRRPAADPVFSCRRASLGPLGRLGRRPARGLPWLSAAWPSATARGGGGGGFAATRILDAVARASYRVGRGAPGR